MFCPSCKVEYRPGFTRCADCGVGLVAALEAEPAPAKRAALTGDSLELLIESPNLSACDEVAAALTSADIPFNFKTSKGQPVILAQGTPAYSLWVSPSDLAAAQAVLAEVVGPQPTEVELDQLEIPAGTDQPGEDSSAEDIPDDWDPQSADTEVWSGMDSKSAQMFQDCLRENGIPSRRLDQGEARRVLVPHDDEKRAREILREIVNASPPE